MKTQEKKVEKTNVSQGANHFRNLVKWMNARPEMLNENKSPLTLLAEYKDWLDKNK